MPRQAIQYKVFPSERHFYVIDKKTGLYTQHKKTSTFFHTILGNGEIVQPSEGYDEKRNAFKSCESVWVAHARAQGHQFFHNAYATPAAARKAFLAAHPVPYTKDSMLPTMRAPMVPINKLSDIVTKKR